MFEDLDEAEEIFNATANKEVEIKISTQKSISSVTKNILEKKNKAEQGTLIWKKLVFLLYLSL